MKEFLRDPQWASDALRRTWAPRINRFVETWREIEIHSVAAGFRKMAFIDVLAKDMPMLMDRAEQLGLLATTVTAQPVGEQYSSAVPANAQTGLRVAVHDESISPLNIRRAWKAGHGPAGELLGYPPCCRAFFSEHWGKVIDTTEAMARNANGNGPPECNMLLRWLGIRMVSHLPCSFTCEATVALGTGFEMIGDAIGKGREVMWALQMLDWKMTYSRVGGIGIVTTPAFRLVFTTDPGEFKLYRDGVQTVLADPDIWTDNGFSTEEAMLAAHAVVLDAVAKLNFQGGTVLDLGCGDGTLLSRISQIPGAACFGVDLAADRIERGRARYPKLHLKTERIESLWDAWDSPADPDDKFDLLLLMPGRLTEIGEKGKEIAALIPRFVKRVIVYAYADNVPEGGIQELCARNGLAQPVVNICKSDACEAGELVLGTRY